MITNSQNVQFFQLAHDLGIYFDDLSNRYQESPIYFENFGGEDLISQSKLIKLGEAKSDRIKIYNEEQYISASSLLQKKDSMNKSFRNITKNILILFLMISSCALQAQNEAYYIELLNDTKFKGQTEVKVYGGRADIVNEEYAIEVEWADHWKNAIGQSLWYALQTNKKPGIVVLMKSLSDRKYGIMLQSAIDYAGLSDKIKVWFYPEDFGVTFEDLQAARSIHTKDQIENHGNYTKNINSGIRHKSTCAYFDCKNCAPCDPNDGKACGKCGG